MENNNGKWTDFLPSPNYSEDLSRTPCQRWPRTDPIWPLAHTRQLLVLVPVKRRSMRPALIVIISDRLPGTISNPHHLSCRQVSPPWWRSLASSAVKPCCGSPQTAANTLKKQKGQYIQYILYTLYFRHYKVNVALYFVFASRLFIFENRQNIKQFWQTFESNLFLSLLFPSGYHFLTWLARIFRLLKAHQLTWSRKMWWKLKWAKKSQTSEWSSNWSL